MRSGTPEPLDGWALRASQLTEDPAAHTFVRKGSNDGAPGYAACQRHAGAQTLDLVRDTRFAGAYLVPGDDS